MSTAEPLDTAPSLNDRVEQALRDFVGTASKQIAAVDDELVLLLDAASDFVLAGGKRLRPAFCYWGYRAVGGADSDAVVRAAASLELLHACALVHDDVIDGSDTRRGAPSAHRRFAAAHRERGWARDADRFGGAAAILLGDLFLVWADTMIATSGISERAWRSAREVYDTMRVELMAGQYLDVVEQVRGVGSVAGSLRVARYKTATYTVERPLHLGAAIGDATPEQTAGFSGFGLPLGEAFQLRDDMLGVFGDPAVTGKPAGDDLREGKRTVLVALAEEAATPAQRAVLEHGLGNPSLTDVDVAELRGLITDTGAADHVELMIRSRLADAFAVLDGLDLAPEGRAALVDLASAATDRSS
ncbi:MAG TPA: polyprenyl synthetase family protein [Mycobacteriales bacterium]|nr:polyprenyl synthetase family protein [Mycobacteriales bacterium]